MEKLRKRRSSSIVSEFVRFQSELQLSGGQQPQQDQEDDYRRSRRASSALATISRRHTTATIRPLRNSFPSATMTMQETIRKNNTTKGKTVNNGQHQTSDVVRHSDSVINGDDNVFAPNMEPKLSPADMCEKMHSVGSDPSPPQCQISDDKPDIGTVMDDIPLACQNDGNEHRNSMTIKYSPTGDVVSIVEVAQEPDTPFSHQNNTRNVAKKQRIPICVSFGFGHDVYLYFTSKKL